MVIGMDILRINDHSLLTDFYLENGLEIENGWENKMGALRSAGAYENGEMIGAATVSRRFDVTVLDYIAVKKDVRRQNIGKKLFLEIIEDDEIYLTARTPAFFYALGCIETDEKPELLGECTDCEQRLNGTCVPTVMKYSGGKKR